LRTLPPLSLYIHIPWCVRKCPYCDFNSHEVAVIPEDEYTANLIKDMESQKQWAQGRKLQSIFIGGGTPSLFSGKSIGKILESADRLYGFAENIEITLEVNPGRSEYDKLDNFFQAGVNRLSIGAQSFNDQRLKSLGRIHNSGEAEMAIVNARKAGFASINIDLMHGLPDQTASEALYDLEKALYLEPEHLSWYQLTIEPNTAFFNEPPHLPEEDILHNIGSEGLNYIKGHNFSQYEVSAFSLAGHHSIHNLNYWQFGDYLAAGAGAHGKITLDTGDITRFQKTRLPADYLDPEKNHTSLVKTVAKEDQALEFMMNALRLTKGVTKTLLSERTQLSPQQIEFQYQSLVDKGLLEESETHFRTTKIGMRF